MQESNTEWRVVVEPTRQGLAEQAFVAWKDDNQFLSRNLADADTRIDIIRGTDGKTYYRYLIRVSHWLIEPTSKTDNI